MSVLVRRVGLRDYVPHVTKTCSVHPICRRVRDGLAASNGKAV